MLKHLDDDQAIIGERHGPSDTLILQHGVAEDHARKLRIDAQCSAAPTRVIRHLAQGQPEFLGQRCEVGAGGRFELLLQLLLPIAEQIGGPIAPIVGLDLRVRVAERARVLGLDFGERMM